jgi:hypothetical protein
MSREAMKAKIHSSHKLSEPRCEILAPAGTPRFYSVIICEKCGAQYAEHAAGLFIDEELKKVCNG